MCTAYMKNGKKLDSLDFSGDARLLAQCTPIYETLPGWQQELRSCRSWQKLPKAAQTYVQYIEEKVGVPVQTVSVGPERSAMFSRG